jgi:hypothetical protein
VSAPLPSLATRRSYDATVYRVAPPDGPGLRIDRHDPGAEAWLAAAGARRMALMTAWHPMSRLRPDRLNRARLAMLARRAAAGAVCLLPSMGEGAGDWPPEPGLAVAGLTRGRALRLARRFRQHAIVWVEPGRPPRLLWCWAGRDAVAHHLPRCRRREALLRQTRRWPAVLTLA